jgi:hypothetical protein
VASCISLSKISGFIGALISVRFNGAGQKPGRSNAPRPT